MSHIKVHGLATVTFIGEQRRTSTGTILTFGIAFNSGYGTNRKDNLMECRIFNAAADVFLAHFRKGSRISIANANLTIEEYNGKSKPVALVSEIDFPLSKDEAREFETQGSVSDSAYPPPRPMTETRGSYIPPSNQVKPPQPFARTQSMAKPVTKSETAWSDGTPVVAPDEAIPDDDIPF